MFRQDADPRQFNQDEHDHFIAYRFARPNH
jgi:hypothetical protein